MERHAGDHPHRAGAELTVLKEDASHYGDVLATGVSWAYETAFLEPIVEPGDVVIDVGANYGYTSSYFSSEVGPEGFVLSLEPEPDTRSLLSHNMRTNGHTNVEVVAAAAGAEPGTARLFRSGTNLATHSLSDALVRNIKDSVTVEVVTLDELCAIRLDGRPPTVLKIDAEGWEWGVLEGAADVLRRYRPALWMEFWPDGLRANGHDPQWVLDLLTELGYAVTAHDLVLETALPLEPDEIVPYCDEATERFRREGKHNLVGILYLHATHADTQHAAHPR
ncbi:FkbM family methyltransferase [Nocardioides bigeumensis]|uniref:Methyltransferase FkbM domain-containing protein n=1 Tax=Nocardioides bigeumensis TaxID=433657 RepID=A0ABN2YKR4_9ACTN